MTHETQTDILVLLEQTGCLTSGAVGMLRGYVQRWQVSSFHALLETAVLSESALADALAESLGIARVYNLKSLAPAESALSTLGFCRAREWECYLVWNPAGGQDAVEVIMADPTQQSRFIELKQELNCEMTLAVAERSDIVGAIDELFPLSMQLPSLFGK